MNIVVACGVVWGLIKLVSLIIVLIILISFLIELLRRVK